MSEPDLPQLETLQIPDPNPEPPKPTIPEQIEELVQNVRDIEDRIAGLEILVGRPWPIKPGDRFPPPQTLFEAIQWSAEHIKLVAMMKR